MDVDRRNPEKDPVARLWWLRPPASTPPSRIVMRPQSSRVPWLLVSRRSRTG